MEQWIRGDIIGGPVADAVQVLLDYGTSSVAKLERMRGATGADGRTRGCYVFHGALTGRWSSQEMHSLPRPPKGLDVNAVLAGLLAPGGPVPHAMGLKERITACLRAVVAAPLGQELVVCDFAQVENRVLCWLAGQSDMLEAYRRGEDPYIAAAKAAGSGTVSSASCWCSAPGSAAARTCC